MSKIKTWSDHIIKHFWHRSSVCKLTETLSDEEALKIMKVGSTFSVSVDSKQSPFPAIDR